ncbi:ATP-dependent zinc metalloprotease FtsH [Candidatus Zinderia endosymbiont of Aphrophora alni]|uniref:ATP-dependent zinc metalloprotease FtsH n=1 Tax=Candidatus Zinderia endosymbiont of Aphrophora alni TaxID=3077951 RepID=UPI0030CB7308
MRRKIYKSFLFLLLFFLIFTHIKRINNSKIILYKKIPYSKFINDIKTKNIKKVLINNNILKAKNLNNEYIKTTITSLDKKLISRLIKNKIIFEVKNGHQKSWVLQTFLSWLPTFMVAFFWMLFIKNMQNSKNVNFSFNKSKAKMINTKDNFINFSNVAGCNEAKIELKEIIEFLKNSQKFKKLGGYMPHGILMVGPPGTGKTLLARAIAGEAKVPFFTISGSEFVELFVGLGALRVRNMFNNAKKYSPCIIFIDEIDAVGRQRGYELSGGGNSEREQTLNQILVEMDGFEKNSGIIIIAATNRVDVLDKALLRPGRFDKQILITLPDVKGREEILKIHIKKVPILINMKISILARSTPGFSGADLANLVNEAAINAASLNKKVVEMENFEYAKDKIILGPENKSIFIQEKDRINTAYHESGHVIVAKTFPKSDPIHKVTIIPRGYSLGITWQLPKYDKINLYKKRILEKISILLAGRISEEIFTKNSSTGASGDFKRATKLAKDMVICYGMSKIIGVVYHKNDDSFNKNYNKNISEKTKYKIDKEIKKIINTQYQISKNIIKNNKNKIKIMVKKLLKKETLNSKEINKIMKIKN